MACVKSAVISFGIVGELLGTLKHKEITKMQKAISKVITGAAASVAFMLSQQRAS